MHNIKNELRGRGLSSRPFYTTVFLLSILTAYSFLAHTYNRPHESSSLQVLSKRSKSDTPECSEVHLADDQCAFVKQYCRDDDAGLLPYLQLYYCSLGNAKPVAFVMLVVWLALLFTTIGIAASDFFSVNLSTIAAILGLSESLAGVTFLAFGNGSPDVFSTFAAMSSNSASMAVGELIGAASFITGVVAGSMALVREFRVDKKTYARDICFFIVAVSFTMFFLADGHLRFWECCIMIGYYIIYVVTVVGQHWYTTRRRYRRRREGEARSHLYGSVGTSVDELAGEPYRDDPDDVDNRSAPVPDISVLENGLRIEIDGHAPPTSPSEPDEEMSEDHERLVAAEVTSSMRILRTGGRRRNTMNPIRPSLVGALEFRSALAQLQRESNLKLSSIPDYAGQAGHSGHGRSYSAAVLDNRPRRLTADTARQSQYGATVSEGITEQTGRARALSSGSAPVSLEVPSDFLGRQHAPFGEQTTPSPGPSYTVGGSLAPPPAGPTGAHSIDVSPRTMSPNLQLQIPTTQLQVPTSQSSQASSPSSPFPMYTDSPAMLTPHPHTDHVDFSLPPSAFRERSFPELPILGEQPRPIRWWPYSVLPPPHVLFATLFPTLQGWREKSIWDKFVSMISLPSIFLLVITLPVVENDSTEGDSVIDTAFDRASHASVAHPSVAHIAPPVSVEPRGIEHETEWERYRRHTLTRNHSYHTMGSGSASMAGLVNEETLVSPAGDLARGVEAALQGKPVSQVPSISNANDETLAWNRWLVCLQVFTGPLFSVFVLWANMLEELESPGKTLVQMILWTLLGSLVLLTLLLMCTSEQRRPKYHYVLCFLGFIISIAWISTIAGEVVGVLKTFGVVLGISEALLGLTIFAAGNSVGDLVADITVARLGYPVMAL
jgi:solute carrier family 24 (sodium/potassium/calcium exchanger), member 6